MQILDLMNTEGIRNFIYDNSKRKVLIGSRRIGKTTALLLDIHRQSYNNKRMFFFTKINSTNRYIYEDIKNICECFDTDIELICKNTFYKIKINNSVLYIGTFEALNRMFDNHDDIYIDEPDSFWDNRNIVKIIRRHENRIVIAGSKHGDTSLMKEISADITISRHVAINMDMAIELKDILSYKAIRNEILCDFWSDYNADSR